MNPGLERNVLFNSGRTQLTGTLVSVNISQKQQTIKFYGSKNVRKTLKMIVMLFFQYSILTILCVWTSAWCFRLQIVKINLFKLIAGISDSFVEGLHMEHRRVKPPKAATEGGVVVGGGGGGTGGQNLHPSLLSLLLSLLAVFHTLLCGGSRTGPLSFMCFHMLLRAALRAV